MNENTGVPLIARTWRGSVREKDRDTYLAYLHETGLEEYRSTPGNRGVLTLCRNVDGLAEFLIVTLWESRDAIRAFAGDDIDRAVYYPRDDEFLVDRHPVSHYEVVFRA